MIIRYLLSSLYALLIVSLTGLTELAYAISCSDVVDQASGTTYSSALGQFLYINGKTYAVARSAVTGVTSLPDGYFAFTPGITREYLFDGIDNASLKKLLAAGKYGVARPVNIQDAGIQEFITKNYGKYLQGAASSGGTLINAWKEFGAPVFTDMQGLPLSYTNWDSDPTIIPQPSAVAMRSDGKWVPVSSGQKLSQVVEFDGKLDCAIDMTPNTTPPPPPPPSPPPLDPSLMQNMFCGKDLNGNGYVGEVGELVNCTKSEDNQGICPFDNIKCELNQRSPFCPPSGAVNTSRLPSPMCQMAGETFCPSSGAYLVNPELCFKDAYKGCPAGYSFMEANNRCEKRPDCAGGTSYNDVTNKCEWTMDYAATLAGGVTYDVPIFGPGSSTLWGSLLNGSSGTLYGYAATLNASQPSGSVSLYRRTWEGNIYNYWLAHHPLYGYATGKVAADFIPICLRPGIEGYFTCGPSGDVWSTGYDPETGIYFPYVEYVPVVGYLSPSVATYGGTYTCPSGGALSGSTCNVTNQANPTCPGGSFQDNGIAGDACFVPYTPVCNDPAFVVQVPGQPDKCQSAAIHECPAGYTWNGSPINMCEAVPVCEVGTYQAQSNSCYIDQSCPVAANSCAGNSEAANCPAGTTLDGLSNMCQADSTVTCPAGYTWDSAIDQCTQTITCLESGTYNPVTNLCEKKYDGICPEGYVFDSTSNICAVASTCPAGGVFNPATEKCESSSEPSCSDGFNYDSNDSVCYAAALCLDGGTVNALAGSCTLPYMYSCFMGWYNSTTDRCEAPPSCPSGFTFDSTTDKCLKYDTYSATPNYSCPSGGSLSGTTCTVGSNYAATGVYSCHSGGSLSGTSCISESSYGATPVYYCPSGGTLSGSTCTASSSYAAAANFSCPNSNWTLSGSYCYTNHSCDVDYMCGSSSCDDPSEVALVTSYASLGCNCYVDDYLGEIYCTSASQPATGSYSCTSGGTLSGSTCSTVSSYAAALSYSCPSGGTLSGSTCYNSSSYAAALNYSCPSGGTLSGSTCYNSSSYAATASSYSCNAGDTLSGTTCTHAVQNNPTCSAGTFDSAGNLCVAGYSKFCTLGWVYNAGIDQCTKTVSCPEGSLHNTSNGRCEKTSTPRCPTSYSYASSETICYSPPLCTNGFYSHGRCEASATKDCGTYALDSSGTVCSQNISCPNDPAYALNSSITFSNSLDKCVSTAQHECPAGTAYGGLPFAKCRVIPACSNGLTFNSQTGSCCPGETPSCHQNTGETEMIIPGVSVQHCSPYACVDPSVVADTGTPMDESYLQDDGEKDAEGNCLGTVYIFGGKPSRCRPPGMTVGMINDCCAPGGTVMDEDTGSNIQTAISTVKTLYDLGTIAYGAYLASTGAEGMAAAGELAMDAGGIVSDAIAVTMEAIANGAELGSAMLEGMTAFASNLITSPAVIVGIVMFVAMKVLMGGGCDRGDLQTTMSRDSGMCHEIGGFCYKKWALVGCVQQAEGFCCYNSKLARIIAEQGRPQLNVFGLDGGWGAANDPNCRGFTPEEFQSLDFNKIDLSEYYDVVQKDLENKLDDAQQNVLDIIQNRVNQVNQ